MQKGRILKWAKTNTGSFNNANNFSIHQATFNAAETINYTNHNYHSNDEEKKKEISKWLAAPDCFTNLTTALDKRVIGTSQWILEDSAYKKWMEKAGIWWIQGKAGSGKTFLITYIIKNLEDTTSASFVVYHYFDTCDTTGSKTIGCSGSQDPSCLEEFVSIIKAWAFLFEAN
ncbi:hypothetical protein EV361DRAFT_1037938 [Lentinula raphanica]|nr:hypothetical protein EV361DRAFT_1037938 [Lentinula raphanica]